MYFKMIFTVLLMASDFEEFISHDMLPNFDYKFREDNLMVDSKVVPQIRKMTQEELGKFLHNFD